MGGSNKLRNWQALCPNCHALKTREDRKRISDSFKIDPIIDRLIDIIFFVVISFTLALLFIYEKVRDVIFNLFGV
jgi:hypothetical protein